MEKSSLSVQSASKAERASIPYLFALISIFLRARNDLNEFPDSFVILVYFLYNVSRLLVPAYTVAVLAIEPIYMAY